MQPPQPEPQSQPKRLVLARERAEPLSAGRPGIRRYRLARLEQVAGHGLAPRGSLTGQPADSAPEARTAASSEPGRRPGTDPESGANAG